MEASQSTEIPPELRAEMVRRARDKRFRFVEFDDLEPCVWNPTQVLNPTSGIPFTDITAWHFIADQLEAGCMVSTVRLRVPPGDTGYEFYFQGAAGQPDIYVKVRLHRDKIKGRSFHNSTRAGE
jgi:hypothetical protein